MFLLENYIQSYYYTCRSVPLAELRITDDSERQILQTKQPSSAESQVSAPTMKPTPERFPSSMQVHRSHQPAWAPSSAAAPYKLRTPRVSPATLATSNAMSASLSTSVWRAAEGRGRALQQMRWMEDVAQAILSETQRVAPKEQEIPTRSLPGSRVCSQVALDSSVGWSFLAVVRRNQPLEEIRLHPC